MGNSSNIEYTVNKLNFDPNDSKFTFESKNEFTHIDKNFFSNFYLVFKLMLKKLVTSVSFWVFIILGIILFFIFESAIFSFIGNFISDGYDHIYENNNLDVNVDYLINNLVSKNGFDWFTNNYLYDTTITYNYFAIEFSMMLSIIYTFGLIFPLIIITLLIFPSFILSYRESNLLKSLKMAGISKIQFFISYLLSSIFVIISYILIMTLIIMPLSYLIILPNVYSTYGEGSHNLFTYNIDKSFFSHYIDSPWFIFSNFYSSMNQLNFFLILILGVLSFILIGYFIGSKSKSIKSITWFIILIITLQFIITITTPYNFNKIPFADHSNNDNNELNFTLNLFIFIIKFLFVLTPITIINKGLILSSNAGIYQNGNSEKYFSDKFDDVFWNTEHNSGNDLYMFTFVLSLIVSILIIGYITLRFAQITKYETTR